MKPENEQFLKDNLHHFLTLERAFYLRGLNVHERDGMERIMSEEIAPGYRCDKTCPDCVAEMVRLLYRSYYNYLKAKLNDTGVYKDLTEGIQQMMNREVEQPVHEWQGNPAVPIVIAANFPSNLPDIKDLLFYQLEKI